METERNANREMDFRLYFWMYSNERTVQLLLNFTLSLLSSADWILCWAEQTSLWISGAFTGRSWRCQWVVQGSADAVYLWATMRAVTKATWLLISFWVRHGIFMTHCFRLYLLPLHAFTQKWPLSFFSKDFSRSGLFNDCTLQLGRGVYSTLAQSGVI